MSVSTAIYTLELANGAVVSGAIHGSGGRIGTGIGNWDRVERAIARASRGSETGLSEPQPGHARMYTNVDRDGGAELHVDLRGARVLAVELADEIVMGPCPFCRDKNCCVHQLPDARGYDIRNGAP